MEQVTIQFRAIRKSDYPALQKIICTTWNYEKFCSKKIAKALSKLYLATCLSNQTYTCVAIHCKEPVGIIMGKNERIHRTLLRHTIHRLFAILGLLWRKEGRRVLRMFDGFDQINTSLLAKSPQKFEAEVAFFAVRSDQRGTGIGKELFSRLKQYMTTQKIDSFYLYTDTSCNYGFYEHQGMKRLGESKHRLPAYENQEISFFLYGYH